MNLKSLFSINLHSDTDQNVRRGNSSGSGQHHLLMQLLNYVGRYSEHDLIGTEENVLYKNGAVK